ncbi:MAG: DNA-binding response OmpR family regulator [Alphaproteobacteria bacterium]
MDEIRVLAMDDDKGFRDFLKAFLEKSECRWKIASDMGEFELAYRDLDPTVILLDMVMPGTDGIEVMQWLTEQSYGSRLVLISGYNPMYTDSAKSLGSARGLADVISLQKPVRLAALREALGVF